MDLFVVVEAVEVLFEDVDDEGEELGLLFCGSLFDLFEVVAYTVGLSHLALPVVIGQITL